MEQYEEVKIPNSNLENPQHMISFSYAKFEGGFLMRENFSKKRFPLSGFGFVAIHATEIGKALLQHLQKRMPLMKEGSIVTVEVQVRDGGVNPFGMGNGLLMMDPYGGGPANYWKRIMQQFAFMFNLEPTIINNYTPDQAGFVKFQTDVQNDPNLKKPTWGNSGFGFGMDDPFAFSPGLDEVYNTTNKDDIVEEIKTPKGTILR